MKLSTMDDIRDLLHDGMRIGLGGFWFVRTPMELVDQILSAGVRDLEIVCFGGGLGVERLLAAGRVRTLYFSFHSMDVMGTAPQFRRAVERDGVTAVELTTQVLGKALQAAQENLPFLPVRGPLDSEFLDGPFPLAPLDCPLTGIRLYAVPALPLDVAFVHATRADVHGNIEVVGARGVDRRLLGAARQRVVSVEEVAGEFRGPQQAHRTTVPRFLVDHVVTAPGGARPSSCLPWYGTDFAAIQAELARTQPAAPTIAPTIAPTVTTAAHREDSSDPDEPTGAEMLVYHLARQLRDDGIYTVGSVTPVSMVAYQLAKHTHAPNLAVIPFAGLVDVSPYAVGVATAEQKALAAASGFWGMDDLYEWLYEAGHIDAEIFCPAQIDGRAQINNSLVRRPDGTPVRLPGQAGIADVATLHRNLYLYVPRHTPTRLVSDVDFRGGSRALVDDDERTKAGLRPGVTTMVTNLCVLRFDNRQRRFLLDSTHPGVSVDEVVANTGFELMVPDSVPTSSRPSRDLLTILRRDVDPLGVRDLETVPSAERGLLLQAILDREQIHEGRSH